MEVVVREYQDGDLEAMRLIWNKVVEDGIAFPEDEPIRDTNEMKGFANEQTFVGCAVVDGEVLGLYILHPNGIGRKKHVANASYAVKAGLRGMGIGRKLVVDSLRRAKEFGFVGMQYNAVVDSNLGAKHLYESIGFRRVGLIEEGFRMKDGSFEDMVIYYYHFKTMDGVCG